MKPNQTKWWAIGIAVVLRGKSQAARALLGALQDRHRGVRGEAAKALGAIGSEAVPAMAEASG